MKAMESSSRNRDGLKLFVVLVAMISVAMCVTIAISDENDANNGYLYFTEGDFEYHSRGNSNATVYRCTDEAMAKTILIIPDEVTHNGKTYKIDDIGDNAIGGNMTVKSVIIGNNVKWIGMYSFACCTNLESVVMGENVETIGVSAFVGCKNLKTVVMDTSIIEIKESAFKYCESLENITWPDEKLENDESPSNDKTRKRIIRERAFYECALETVVLPEGTIYIGEEAFHGNEELDTVVIPGSVETIGNEAFGDCPNIDKFAFGDFAETVEFGDHIFSYEDGSNGIVDYTFKNMNGKEYTFTDANVESGVFDDRAYDVDENGTALNVLALYLDANGGWCESDYAFTDKDGILVEALPIPTREGYTFNGWYDGDKKVDIGSVFDENTVLTAKWTAVSSSTDSYIPLLIMAILAIIAIIGIAVYPRKE